MSPIRRFPVRPPRAATEAESILGPEDATLLDVVDNVLTKGVMLTGDLAIGVAKVDLIYARVSLLLCAADRVLPGEDPDPMTRHSARFQARQRARRRRA
jgi:hypothetical protein